MLTFHLRWSDLLQDSWRTTSRGWAVGESRVEPFRNPALEQYAVSAEGRLLIVSRERCHGRPSLPVPPGDGFPAAVELGQWEALLREAREWPLQAISLVVSTWAEEPRVTILTGPWATGAVYAVARGDELFGHWDPARLYAHLPEPRFDPLLTALFLATFEAPYGSRTLFNGMRLLTDRSRATWVTQGAQRELRVDYPPAVGWPRPTDLKPDADVLKAFWEILTSSVERWLPPGTRCAGAEVSGGLDSALVAAAAAECLDSPLETFGVILLNRMGEEQRARRQELTARFGFRDHTLEIADHLPLAPGSTRLENGVVPWEECYYEAMDGVLALAARRGRGVMFTGVGGDELCRVHWAERDPAATHPVPPREEKGEISPFITALPIEMLQAESDRIEQAPRSLIPGSALDAAAHGSSIAMRRGLWSVHPLCTPELIRLCARLPREWHRNRAVERRMLAHLGCSDNVAYPPAPDDFSPACTRAMRHAARPLLERLFRESRMAEMGFVDPDRLLRDYRTWCEDPDDNDSVPFYGAAILELTARSLENPPPGVGQLLADSADSKGELILAR